MISAPPLNAGETLLYDHVPSLAKFKRTALWVIGISLIPTAVNFVVFPDTLWVAVPMFVACLFLWQERLSMGKHRAWVTDQRVILQKGRDVAMADITGVTTWGSIVTLINADQRIRLYYSDTPADFQAAIEAARKAST